MTTDQYCYGSNNDHGGCGRCQRTGVLCEETDTRHEWGVWRQDPHHDGEGGEA